MMVALGVLAFLFLVVQPSDVDVVPPEEHSPPPSDEVEALLPKSSSLKERRSSGGGEAESIAFIDAWRIPGVAQYAFCLFFSKLIAYTFLYWLPYYIKSTPIQGRRMSAREAGDLSVLFDVGGVAGACLLPTCIACCGVASVGWHPAAVHVGGGHLFAVMIYPEPKGGCKDHVPACLVRVQVQLCLCFKVAGCAHPDVWQHQPVVSS